MGVQKWSRTKPRSWKQCQNNFEDRKKMKLPIILIFNVYFGFK